MAFWWWCINFTINEFIEFDRCTNIPIPSTKEQGQKDSVLILMKTSCEFFRTKSFDLKKKESLAIHANKTMRTKWSNMCSHGLSDLYMCTFNCNRLLNAKCIDKICWNEKWPMWLIDFGFTLDRPTIWIGSMHSHTNEQPKTRK